LSRFIVVASKLIQGGFLAIRDKLEPAATYTEEMLEDVRLTVAGAPLSEAADWLPAMEQLGEGIFLRIRLEAVRAWLKRPAVQRRGDALRQGTRNYAARHQVEMMFPGLPSILLHSFPTR
jgi:hypothetical protein